MNDTATKQSNNRLNITLTPDLEFALGALSKRNRMPKSKIAVSLIEDALEIFEDQILAELANERKKQKVKYLSHEEVWGKYA